MKKNRLYTLLALLVILFWGTTFVSTKILLTRLSPVQIMLLRYLIAYAALLVIHPKFHRPEGLRQELCCIAAALCGSTLYFLAENTALSYTQASNVSLLISAAPILTSVVAHLFTRDERLTRHAFYGFFLAMAGIFLVVFNGRFVLKLSPRRPARPGGRPLVGVLHGHPAQDRQPLPAGLHHPAHLLLFDRHHAALSAL